MVVSFIAGFLLRERRLIGNESAERYGQIWMHLIRREVAAGERSLWFAFDVLSADDSS